MLKPSHPHKTLLAYLSDGNNALLYRAYDVIKLHRDPVARELAHALAVRAARYMPGAQVKTAAQTQAQVDQIYNELLTCPPTQLSAVKLYRANGYPPETPGAVQLFVLPATICARMARDVLEAVTADYNEKLALMRDVLDDKFASTVHHGDEYRARRDALAALRTLHRVPGYGGDPTAGAQAKREAALATSPTVRLNVQAQQLAAQAQKLAQLEALLKEVAQHVGLLPGGGA